MPSVTATTTAMGMATCLRAQRCPLLDEDVSHVVVRVDDEACTLPMLPLVAWT